MRCCVPFCKNTSDNVSAESEEISFHNFPSDVRLRAAWLRAIGKQDSHLPDSAVVCSQHFLNDDIYEADSGIRQIHTGALPSTVQVCMICLDTDSKLFQMSRYKLEEAYEKLTGYILCDQGNLKQTVCIQCAQRLINSCQFRDKILRARALMMDLVEKHEFITRRHIKMINRTTNKLKSDIVVTTLGPDPCDLYVLEHPSENKQTDSEVTVHRVVVKNEDSYDSMSVDEDTEVTNEDDNNADYVNDDFVVSNEAYTSDDSIMLETKLLDEAVSGALERKRAVTEQENQTQDPLKLESAPFQCTVCFKDFFHEHACISRQAIQKLHDETHSSAELAQTAVDPLSARHATSDENKADTVRRSPQVFKINNGQTDNLSYDTDSVIDISRLTNCVVKLYDVFKKCEKRVPVRDESRAKTRTAMSCCDSQCQIDTASEHFNVQVASQNEHIGRDTNKVKVSNRNVSNTVRSGTECSNDDDNEGCLLVGRNLFTCDVCRETFKQKSHLVEHIKTHTNEKYYSCELCKYKCAQKGHLAIHMRTHTGEKSYSCELCKYKCSASSTLVRHMRTHTGEKPYTCRLCKYKCAQKSHLLRHMRTHTGEKPFSCMLCKYKCAQKWDLLSHMRSHTGEKPYSCEFCKYKCAQKGPLAIHMRTHTGEKPHACNLCKYKCAQKSHIVRHMRTHTGEKLHSCKVCKYKCLESDNLVKHMRTHTGEKPFSCELCKYKCAQKSNLVTHMKTHTGEKPYSRTAMSCCDSQCPIDTASEHLNVQVASQNEHIGRDTNKVKVSNRNVSNTVRSGTECSNDDDNEGCLFVGRNSFTCDVCRKMFKQKNHLVGHIKTHTGEKHYSCELCKYKCSASSSLVRHMRTHTGEKPYTCRLCKYKCAQKSHLLRHMRTHTGEKPFSCMLCKYKCAQKWDLLSHMRSHTGEKPYSCEFCKYKCAQKGPLAIHMRTHTGEKPHSCKLCKYKSARKSHIVRHLRTHTGEKLHSCKVCKYKCLESDNLVKHMRTHTGEKPFSCELCKYKCAQKSNLVTHMKTHTGEKPYSRTAMSCCDSQCQIDTASEHLNVQDASQNEHIGRDTNKVKVSNRNVSNTVRSGTECSNDDDNEGCLLVGRNLFTCDVCRKMFKQKNHLVEHIKTHTGEKHYSCELCKYKCSASSTLVRHMKTHTGEKPYTCMLCKYKCAQKSHLLRHMRTHTGEKPFSCLLCKYKCAQKWDLLSHMRSHTGEKPHSCMLCKYKCAQKNNLVRHMRTHTSEKPYSCDLCKYKCSCSGGLVRHMRTHTGERPYSCELCKYKCIQKTQLVKHMRTHAGKALSL